MRNKKLASTFLAGMLAVTMAMPVMAAEGGSLNVPVVTKSAVIRVDVPTSMQIAVNQFQLNDTGSQVYSTPFTMENKSEIPVKVDVTSTATLKNTTKLLGTKAAATSSTKAGEAWLAVAAEISAGSYNASGVTALTDTDRNVATFAQDAAAPTSAEANQTFYLNASSGMAYKLLNTNEDASKIEYAQFYELEPITGLTSGSEGAELDAMLKENEIYVVATASVANGAALTKYTAGTTYSNTNTYYKAAVAATAKASIDATKLYVYGDGAADATAATVGKTQFRYIGRLSEGQESWAKDDIPSVAIAYDIVGVQTTTYNDKVANCIYGLYKEPNRAPSVPTTWTLTAGTEATLSVDLGLGTKAATGIDSILFGGNDVLGATINYDAAAKELKIASDVVDVLKGLTGTQKITVKFNDTDETTIDVTFN